MFRSIPAAIDDSCLQVMGFHATNAIEFDASKKNINSNNKHNFIFRPRLAVSEEVKKISPFALFEFPWVSFFYGDLWSFLDNSKAKDPVNHHMLVSQM